MYDLSIIIPARNEMFLGNTIADILAHTEGDTEIIAILDGEWPNEPIPDNPRLTLIQHFTSIGQRAASNEAARISEAKYLMKVDAHCAFDQGFDVKMMALMQDDITMVPVMRNLHAFDWVCEDGHRRYQSPSGVCKECGKPTTMDVVWIPKKNPQSTCYRFDTDMHFQYHNEWGRKLKGDLTETMSIQGSCFMCTRERYFALDLCSEQFNSWGQQGVEVACKTWLSGGRVLVNRTTWYAHMFRTQGGDFGFPYENPESKVQDNRKLSRELFAGDKWDKKIHSFSWLIEKFNPPDWEGVSTNG
jgi:glycosyltransferase involved in cell wall biosynthesis